MYIIQFMTGILICSTAFLGLTVVVIGQIMQRRDTNKHEGKRSLLTWSITIGIVAILSVLSWFLASEVNMYRSIIVFLIYLANTCFTVQLFLFVFGTRQIWVT